MAVSFGQSVDLGKLELLNARIQNLASAPSAPVEGQVYFNTTDKNLYLWADGAWVDLTSQGVVYSPGTGISIAGATISLATGGVSNTHVNASAAIAQSKIANLTTDLAAKAPTANPTFTGTVTVPDGAVSGAAVNLGQLQAVQEGTKAKSARVVSTVNVNVSSPGASHGGKSLANGDILLLTGQTTASQNGPYRYNGASSALTRDPNADTWAELVGARWLIEEGTSKGTRWYSGAEAGGTLGTTALSIIPAPGVDDLVAGDGLSKSGNTVAVDSTVARRNADNTIAGSVIATKVANGLAAVISGTTSGSGRGVVGGSNTGIGVMGVSTLSKGVYGEGAECGVVGYCSNVHGDSGVSASAEGTVPAFKVADGHGSGAAFDANDKGQIINLVDPTAAQDAATKAYVDAATSGARTIKGNVTAGTETTVTHNWGTRDVQVEVFRNSGNYDTVLCEVQRTSTNAVKLVFGTAATAGEYRYVIREIA